MTKIIRKKFMALILTLAMVLSLMPAITLTASAATSATFDFEADVTGLGTKEVRQIKSGETLLVEAATYNMVYSSAISNVVLSGLKSISTDYDITGGFESCLSFSVSGSKTFDLTSLKLQNFDGDTENIVLTSINGTATFSVCDNTTLDVSGLSNAADFQQISSFTITENTSSESYNGYALVFDDVTLNNITSPTPTVTTQAVSSITATTATGNGNITALGSANPTAYGVCWNTTGTPTTSDSKVDKGAASATGAFTAAMTGLTANTTYYVRAYATNTVDTSYGDQVTFTTSALYWTAYAASEYAGGSGTSSDPYLISTAAQLAFFSNQVNAGHTYYGEFFKLTADIDLSGKLWTPIGNPQVRTFDGTFDGDGHVVSSMNVNVTGSGTDNLIAGLFGTVTLSGTVKNLGVTGTVTAQHSGTGVGDCIAGGLVANNFCAVINCFSQVNVSSTSTGNTTYAGSLVGDNYGAITNCYATGNVSSSATTNSFAGVLCGNNSGTCTYAYYNSNATVTGTNSGAGTSKTSEQMKEAAFVTLLNTNKGEGNNSWAAVTSDYPAFATVTLSVDNSTIAENGIATVTATLSAASSSDVTVTLGYTGTATGGGTDYTASSTTITIAAGSLSGTATITAVNDTIDEDDETVIVDITGVTNATESGTQTVTVTITDDDAEPTISVNDQSVAEGNSGTTTLTFTVTLSAASGKTVTANYATADGTATAGTDYTAISTTTLSFAAGETSKTVSVTVTGDTVTEPDETVLLNLSSPGNASISDAQGSGTITNDDALPAISVNDASVTEGDSGTATLTFTVSLDHASASTVTVDYATTDNTATAGTDYTAISTTTLTFAAGDTSKTVSVTVTGDSDFEPNESFYINLSSPTNATILDNQGVGTITNDDAAPTVTLSVDSGTIAENAEVATVTVTLSATSTSDVSVTLGYTGTATGGGTDYTASSTTITIAAGSLSGTATITAVNDTIDEDDETVIVDITGVTNATESGTQTVTVTITDDDAEPTISVNDQSVAEGNSGTTTLTFTVTLSAASGKTVTVDYATADGTATAGTDYTAIGTTTLTFAAGETSKTVGVTVAGDTVTEPDETVLLNLSSPANTSFGDAQGSGTITNDDANPAISINDASVTEGDSGTATLTFTVSLDHASASTVTVNYATADGTATAGTDYTAKSGTLSFAAGETSKTVGVTVAGDIVTEPDETVLLNLSSAGNATISDAQGSGTITNDDGPIVTLSVDSGTIAENGTATVEATLSQTWVNNVTVTLGYTGTATGSGTDYTASSTTITIAAGNLSGTATITAVNDTIDEVDETVIVDITGVTNATESGTQTVTVTITDDDAEPTISVNDPSVAEGNSGTTTLTFTVTLSAASGKTVTVDYATADGTATAGTDYTAIGTTTLTFAAGETSKTVSVTVTGDTVTEPDETVLLNLSSPGNASISDAQGSGTITNDDTSSYGDGGSSPSGSGTSATVIVNGVSKTAGTSQTTTNSSGLTVTTVTVDSNKLEKILTSEQSGATVTIPISVNSDVAAGVLTGEMIKIMENKDATLVVQTDSATYTLPASEINIDAVSQQLGINVSLSDIKVTVSISEPSASMTQVIENAAQDGGFTIMVPAVEYTISCTYGTQTVDVSSFNAYVERTIAIPDGVDTAKITTGVVVDPDGTVHHVPTRVTLIGGKYYAVINSLTNSTYSVIWNSVKFSDVANHWAKDAINNMGSRMVVTGVENNNYAPDRNMTRAEFATIVVRALGLAPGTGESGFDDVTSTAWYCGYVKTASEYGIINGYDSDTFGPNDTITREQTMAILERAMKLTGLNAGLTDGEISLLLSGYADNASVSAYALESAAACVKTGIVTGTSETTLSPKEYVTRAEVAVMVERLLQKSGLI